MRRILSIVLVAVLITAINIQPLQAQKKSVGKAFFASLLVPGLGQHYVGNKGTIKYFAGTEMLLIGAAIGHEKYGSWLEEDYRAYAVEHAGIDPAGKDKDYYIEISKYNSIFIYNEKMRIEREFDFIMPETPENIWVWNSRDSRLDFHFMRVDADKYINRATYFWTGLFFNHLISGIHAAIITRNHNKRIDEHGAASAEPNWTLRAEPRIHGTNPGLKLKFTYGF